MGEDKLVSKNLPWEMHELEERAIFFQLIADNTYDWEVFRDNNGKILYCNQAFERITGYTVYEFVNESITEKDLIHPDDLNYTQKLMQHAQKALESLIDLEFRIITKTGEIKTVNLCSQPVFKYSEFVGFRTSIRDITNFKVSQSLIESEKHFKKLYNHISDAVFYINTSYGTFISANNTAKGLYGYSEDEFVGMAISQIDLKNDKDAVKMLIQSTLEYGELLYETIHKTKNNRIFPVEIKTKIIDDKTIISVVRDISERKKNEQIIKDRNKEIELLLKGSRLVLESKDFLTTAKQIFEFCRQVTGAKAGYVALLNEKGEENEVIFLESGGLPCFVNPNLPMPIRGLRSIVYRNGKTTYDNNYLSSAHAHYMPTGHIPLKNVMFAPLKKDGRVIGLLGLGEKDSDFNEDDAKLTTSFAELISVALVNSKNLDILKSREQQLQKLNQDQNRFMQILSHDLRNPFNSILGYSELLLTNFRNYDEEKLERNLRKIYQVSEKTFNLLDDLLLWSKAQTGIIPFNPQNLIFNTICQEVISSMAEPAEEKNIKIRLDDMDPLTLEADVNLLKIILRNLISNAIKFSNKNGLVSVSAIPHKNFALISVTDNGIGIEKEKMEKLWHISEHHTTIGTSGERGTGLGLYLCKEFIEKHNGKIWVESEAGKGSTFKFTLPLGL